jgi:hypothetical protein
MFQERTNIEHLVSEVFNLTSPRLQPRLPQLVLTPRQQRPSKEPSDLPPLTRVSQRPSKELVFTAINRVSQRDERDYRVLVTNRLHPTSPQLPGSRLPSYRPPLQQHILKKKAADTPTIRHTGFFRPFSPAAKQRSEQTDAAVKPTARRTNESSGGRKEQLRWSREKSEQRYEELFYRKRKLYQQDPQSQQNKA